MYAIRSYYEFSFSTSQVEIVGTFSEDENGNMVCTGTWFYQNTKCDGKGSGTWEATLKSDVTTDKDGDGYSTEQGDCNEEDNSVYPGAAEICGDEIDQDCDGEDLV